MNLDEVKPKPMGDVPGSPENFKLKDFKPRSIFKVPVTQVPQARFPVIDMHGHAWQKDTNIGALVNTLSASNIEKSIILSFQTGDAFDEVVHRFGAYPDKFDIWCGFDYTGYNVPDSGWIDRSVAELEYCHRKGAKGVGELGDKGLGEYYSKPVSAYGMHLNDPRMQPLLQKCGELGMPISVHIADPIWMYQPIDLHNDGLMNAYNWRIDLAEGMLDHAQMIDTLEDAVRQNPHTVFIVCHLANCSHDLEITARMLDRYPNLYTDITSRLKEVCTVPRYAKAFFEKYQDRIVFGSDLGHDPSTTMDFAVRLYPALFRLLESEDEHIYEHDLFKYHWPLYGLGLSDTVLKKIYQENARKIMGLRL